MDSNPWADREQRLADRVPEHEAGVGVAVSAPITPVPLTGERDMTVNLVTFSRKGERKDFKLANGRLVIGRKSDAGLRIPIADISREHCEVSIQGDKIIVRDLKSKNGTFVNDQRIAEKATLTAGDRLRLGPIAFTLQIDGVPEKIEAAPLGVRKKKKKTRPAADAPTEADVDISADIDLGSDDFDIDDLDDLDLDDLSDIDIGSDDVNDLSGADVLGEDDLEELSEDDLVFEDSDEDLSK